MVVGTQPRGSQAGRREFTDSTKRTGLSLECTSQVGSGEAIRVEGVRNEPGRTVLGRHVHGSSCLCVFKHDLTAKRLHSLLIPGVARALEAPPVDSGGSLTFIIRVHDI